MWVNDEKLQAMIRTWREVTANDATTGVTLGYRTAIVQALNDLERLIEESNAMLPPPSPGSERCMIYGGKHQ